MDEIEILMALCEASYMTSIFCSYHEACEIDDDHDHIRVTFSTTASVIVTSDTMFLAHSFSFSLLLFVFLRFFVVSSSLSPDQIIEI